MDEYRLPPLFLGEVYRAAHLNGKSCFCPLVPPDRSVAFACEQTHARRQNGIACPTGGIFAIRECTILFWIYLTHRTPTQTDGPRTVLRKGTRTSILPHIYFEAGKSNKLRCDVSTKAGVIHVASSVELKVKKWTHIAVAIDCLGLRLFIDGNQNAQTRNSHVQSVLESNCEPFFLGQCPSGVAAVASGDPAKDDKFYAFDGYLLDCRFYLRKLTERAIHQYCLRCKPSDKKTAHCGVHIEFKSSDKEPTKRTQIALSQLRQQCSGEARAFNAKLWTPSMDNEVMELFEAAFAAQLKSELSAVWNEGNSGNENKIPTAATQLHIEPFSLTPESSLVAKYSRIQHFDGNVLKQRFLLLRMLNYKMERVFPLVDFSQVGVSWSLAARLCRLRSLIFSDLKQSPWRRVLASTATDRRTSVVVNRPRALRAKEQFAAGAVNENNNLKKTIFGQIYRVLNFIKPSNLRCSPNQRPWNVVFEGEGGTDAGGLFRESLSALGEDLMDHERVALFIKCPNSCGYGDNQEKLVANASMASSLHLSMWTFIGKLMGIAIRGRHYLNIDLPSIMWKPLVGQECDVYDLAEVDSLCAGIIDKLSDVEKAGITDENAFRQLIDCNFTTTASDGRQVTLKPSGERIAVTLANRREYVELLSKYRIHEFDTQIDAIRRGLATIVPISLLPLFTWRQLELMVCGKREIDVDLLRANTVYKDGVKATDKHVLFLWDVLKHEFNNAQRRNFVRFVWGQSRLPTKSEDFHERFGILSCHGKDNDLMLPVSHTCFFTLELPRYSSKDIMHKKLLYAINNCTAIDTDHMAQNVNWDED
mmetsp:Transcript_34570/g.56303  ORF Transcript_34570/g.56303 Transcript_34570/m.56303 type:complete len:817 (+) Transcript_34570:137-2587(+)